MSNFMSEKLLILFNSIVPEFARSGPIPSPLTNEILYLVKNYEPKSN